MLYVWFINAYCCARYSVRRPWARHTARTHFLAGRQHQRRLEPGSHADGEVPIKLMHARMQPAPGRKGQSSTKVRGAKERFETIRFRGLGQMTTDELRSNQAGNQPVALAGTEVLRDLGPFSAGFAVWRTDDVGRAGTGLLSDNTGAEARRLDPRSQNRLLCASLSMHTWRVSNIQGDSRACCKP
jgi:hypothetical protein